MTLRERLRRVVDALSEEEAADALDYVVSRGRDRLARQLDAAPIDDEPLTDEERESLREGREDVAAGRVVSMDDLRRGASRMTRRRDRALQGSISQPDI